MSADLPEAIGRFRIVDVLGSGGMGTVYRGEDPLLKRPVALKVVQGGFRVQDQALRRFRREAEISARLNHPNVITIYDVGEDPREGPFIAMELVDGRSLAAFLREDPPPLDLRLPLLVQAASALGAAHAAGITHRDVKPQNLMVGRDGRVKLMDFGIARSEDSSLTATGAVLGTPAYLAPEQIEGAPPSAATDTYAFGVLAFEMVCGQRPWASTSMSKLIYNIAHEPPTFPEGLDPRLRAVFMKALSKNPAERYPDPVSLTRAILEACPLEAGRRSRLLASLLGDLDDTAPPAPDGPSRSRTLAAVGGAAGLLAAAAAGAWILLTPAPRSIQVESVPAGASVLVDGVAVGLTPLSDTVVASDARTVRLEKTGYRPVETTIAGDQTELRVELEPLPLRVPIRTYPPGAVVFLDGREIGRSPIDALEVPADGRHVVRLRLEGYQERLLEIEGRVPPDTPIILAEIPKPAEPEPPPRAAPSAPKPRPPAATAKRSEPARASAAPTESRDASESGSASGERPGFWRGVGKGFREIGKGFQRFGETVRDTTSETFRGEDD